MKNLLLCLGLLAVMLNSGCLNVNNERYSSTISYTVEESDYHYQISADFDPVLQKKVEALLDKYLRAKGDPSFVNTTLDAQITRNDKRTYHIKFAPGKLVIKLDKSQNYPGTLHDVKELGKELKVITM